MNLAHGDNVNTPLGTGWIEREGREKDFRIRLDSGYEGPLFTEGGGRSPYTKGIEFNASELTYLP